VRLSYKPTIAIFLLTLAILMLAALTKQAFGAETWQVPRSEDGISTEARVECVDGAGCTLSWLCADAQAWAYEDFPPADPLDEGELVRAGASEDPGRSCRVRTTGRVSTWAYRTHNDLSRETLPLPRIGHTAAPSHAERTDGIAPGWGDCRPATLQKACPDAEHLVESCRTAPAHANIGSFPAEILTEGMPGGAFEDFFGGPVNWTEPKGEFDRHWRIERSNTYRVTDYGGRERDFILEYRAPRVTEDVTERITITVENDGYCATTTIVFTILSD